VGPEPPEVPYQGDRSAEDLVVRTPEQVTFSYDTATLGSRFLAQVLDLVVLLAGLGLVTTAALVLLIAVPAVQAGAGAVVGLVLVLAIAAFVGYFAISEAVWSGKTLGKLALRVRVVDGRGGPLGAGQALIRNLVRLVDFLPFYYAVGAVTMFVNRRGQRLGDLAAGTVVVRERRAVSLPDLVLAAQRAPAPSPAAAAVGGRRLEPALKRFVAAYAQRRWQLHPELRAQLAARATAALRSAMPEMVAAHGPLAALERLADEESGA
jgi:uncharacterized RDD family membrane protein YckC